jgi:hypothetical protein
MSITLKIDCKNFEIVPNTLPKLSSSTLEILNGLKLDTSKVDYPLKEKVSELISKNKDLSNLAIKNELLPALRAALAIGIISFTAFTLAAWPFSIPLIIAIVSASIFTSAALSLYSFSQLNVPVRRGVSLPAVLVFGSPFLPVIEIAERNRLLKSINLLEREVIFQFQNHRSFYQNVHHSTLKVLLDKKQEYRETLKCLKNIVDISRDELNAFENNGKKVAFASFEVQSGVDYYSESSKVD